jgi:hypothetical protein
VLMIACCGSLVVVRVLLVFPTRVLERLMTSTSL